MESLQSKRCGVLFVCLGNICRSPAAQGLLEQALEREQLAEHVEVDSCGPAAFNVGKSPDPRSVAAAARRNIDISQQVARQIDDEDYARFDFIIGMDRSNMSSIEAWAPTNFKGRIALLMDFCEHPQQRQIPDPYYAEAEAFDQVLDHINLGIQGLLSHLRTHLNQ